MFTNGRSQIHDVPYLIKYERTFVLVEGECVFYERTFVKVESECVFYERTFVKVEGLVY